MDNDLHIVSKNTYCLTPTDNDATGLFEQETFACRDNLDKYSLNVPAEFNVSLNFADARKINLWPSSEQLASYARASTGWGSTPTSSQGASTPGNTVGAFLVSSALQASGIYDK